VQVAKTTPEEEQGRYREPKGNLKTVIRVLTIMLALFLILYILGIFTRGDIFLPRPSFRGLALGTILILVYLQVPANFAGYKRVPWYDWLLLICGAVGAYYFAAVYPTRIGMAQLKGTPELVLGFLTLISLVEASRRLMGSAFAVIIGIIFIYPMICNRLPGVLMGRGYSFYRVVEQMYMLEGGVFGSFLDIALCTIFAFLLFSAFLGVTGAQKFFLDLALSLVGHVRGGPAKVAVIGSGFMGMMTGSAVANVVGVGSITIPLMKNAGYRPVFAAAVEAVGSTGGQLMPPVMGAVAFLMADTLEISYWSICIYAIIPAILYYLGLFLTVDFEAARTGLKGLPRAQLPSLLKTLQYGWYYIVPILVLVYFLGFRAYAPEIAGLYAVAVLGILACIRKETRLTVKKVLDGLERAVLSSFDIVLICALMGIIVAAFNLTGLSANLASALVTAAGGNLLLLLLLAAVACYIFGMGLPTVAQYMILALLVAPAISQMGVPVVAAHMFILYWGLTSHLTPPVCPAAYAAAGIAGAPMMRTGLQAMFNGISLLLVPFAFVYAPGLLLLPGYRSAAGILIPLLSCLAGVTFLSAAVGGYLFRPCSRLTRVILAVAGVLCVMPEIISSVFGFVLGFSVAVTQIFQRRAVTRQKALEN